MQWIDGRPVYAATDLVAYLACEHLTQLERATRSSAITRKVDRDELTEVVRAANETIRRLNNEAPAPRQHRRPLDLEAELATLDRAHAGEG